MQDRLKFRVWDTIGNCYCPRSHYILLSDGTLIEEIGGEDVICDSKNIEFCIGLKDKNDKLIYDKDIIRVEDNNCLVTWDNDNARYNVSGYGEIAYLNYNEIEIIGNIHENPELLENE